MHKTRDCDKHHGPGQHAWDLRLPSYAKINLGLYILGKRPDGYHDIWTIFQEVAFHDTMYFRAQSGGLTLTTTLPSLSMGEDNLVSQAVRLLHSRYQCPTEVAIHLDKRIPLGAGLGGGSSNAATTLIGLNRLFHLDLERDQLAALGAELGADVPFFLYGGTALATGKGEHLRALATSGGKWYLLVYPDIMISSGWAYKNVNLKLTNFEHIFSVLSQLNETITAGAELPPLCNMLEEPVVNEYPIIRSIKKQLVENGAEWAMMSGSGSTVFGIFSERGVAEKALRHIERPGWVVVVTNALDRNSELLLG